jgi:hypothetical protein
VRFAAVEIIFDPARITYRQLLEFFFQIHDPSTRNRQGNDVGASYRSANFYTSEEQKAIAQDTIADVLRPVAGQGGNGGRPRGRFLGGGIRASGLPDSESGRVHLSFRAAAMEAAEACGLYQGIEQHNRPIDRALRAQYVYPTARQTWCDLRFVSSLLLVGSLW